MKKIRLTLLAMLLAASASAQQYMISETAQQSDNSSSIYLIQTHEIDTLFSRKGRVKRTSEIDSEGLMMVPNAYNATHRTGRNEAMPPQFVISTRNNRFSFGFGGYLNFRTSYDFKGAVDNIDFVTYDIPVPGDYSTRQAVAMDATTSRLFFKGIANSDALGQIVLYIDSDFRGGDEGSYTPRIRVAYLSLLGFTMGRDVTTFCDIKASPITVDFQGPNAYNMNYATLLRYEHSFMHDHRLKVGIAAEMPVASGTYNDNFEPIKQRVPDVPMYVQYAWGDRHQSHVRASGVLRNLYLHNNYTDSNTSLFGWGVQLSGHVNITRRLELYANGVYGKGITPYIQDLTGSGLDFTPNPESPEQVQTMPMWGWQSALRFRFAPRMYLSGGYSKVQVEKHNGYYADSQYKNADYIFGNIFYYITPRCQVAVEYLHGERENMDNASNTANRLNLMFQYNF